MPTTTRGFKQHPKLTAREHLVLRHTERMVSQRPRLGSEEHVKAPSLPPFMVQADAENIRGRSGVAPGAIGTGRDA
jgi:hypothetical protein